MSAGQNYPDRFANGNHNPDEQPSTPVPAKVVDPTPARDALHSVYAAITRAVTPALISTAPDLQGYAALVNALHGPVEAETERNDHAKVLRDLAAATARHIHNTNAQGTTTP